MPQFTAADFCWDGQSSLGMLAFSQQPPGHVSVWSCSTHPAAVQAQEKQSSEGKTSLVFLASGASERVLSELALELGRTARLVPWMRERRIASVGPGPWDPHVTTGHFRIEETRQEE